MKMEKTIITTTVVKKVNALIPDFKLDIWNFGSGNLQERFLAIYVAAQAAIKEM